MGETLQRDRLLCIRTSRLSAKGYIFRGYPNQLPSALAKEKGLTSRIHRKASRNHALRDWEKAGNKSRSRFRARVEHVFGEQRNDMGGRLVRSIGLIRATARIGLKNLAYNMRRLVQLQRLGRVN